MKSLSLENRIPAEIIREIFEYRDGHLYWKVRPRSHFTTDRGHKGFNTRMSGRKAGTPLCPLKLYLISQITYLDQQYSLLLHIATWVVVKGEYPSADIDHEDGNGMNNSIENLKDLGVSLNMQSKAIYKNNKSGLCGISWYKKYDKWIVQGTVNGNKVNLGYFESFFEAACKRKSWELDYNFTERHGK